MSPNKAYYFYNGLRLHFMSESYSFLKYGPATKQSISKYNKLSEAQRYKFEWLGNKFMKTQDMVYACLGCELDNINIQFAEKQTIIDSYIKYKTRRESLTYFLRNEIFNFFTLYDKSNLNFKTLLLGYFCNKFSPEMLIVFDFDDIHISEAINNQEYVFAKESFIKLQKYRSFFNPKNYTHLLTTSTITS